jgi:hypothetical protein
MHKILFWWWNQTSLPRPESSVNARFGRTTAELTEMQALGNGKSCRFVNSYWWKERIAYIFRVKTILRTFERSVTLARVDKAQNSRRLESSRIIKLIFPSFMQINTMEKIKVKVRQSLHMHGRTPRVPVGRGSQISRKSEYEGVTVVSTKHRPPLPPWY